MSMPLRLAASEKPLTILPLAGHSQSTLSFVTIGGGRGLPIGRRGVGHGRGSDRSYRRARGGAAGGAAAAGATAGAGAPRQPPVLPQRPSSPRAARRAAPAREYGSFTALGWVL